MRGRLYPMKFRPILNSMIWGGEKILPFKGLVSEQKMVGESWELSGVKGSESIVANGVLEGKSIAEVLKRYGAKLVGKANYERFKDEFPLLVKFIDAKQDLSIQVHPDDELAAQRHGTKGKNEMWYIVDREAGARLRSGFSTSVTPEEYLRSVEEDRVTDLLSEYQVERGDVFYLPAGRIHSIGAGCFIAEIQQTSNITYRIYDFNRTDSEGNKRELHTEQAKDAIDYSVVGDHRTLYDKGQQNQIQQILSTPFFTISRLNLTEPMMIDYHALDSFVIYLCVEGECRVNEIELKAGETLLLPATTGVVSIDCGACVVLSAHI